jgi:hypothetical protein
MPKWVSYLIRKILILVVEFQHLSMVEWLGENYWALSKIKEVVEAVGLSHPQRCWPSDSIYSLEVS